MQDDEPPREPLHDTWQWKQDAASWLIELSQPANDPAAANKWWAELVSGTLEDFRHLARPTAVTVVGGGSATTLTWQQDTPMALFRNRVVEAVRSRTTPIDDVAMDVDLKTWFRTAESPDRPVLA